MPSGGFISTFFSPTSSQLVLSTVPPDSTYNTGKHRESSSYFIDNYIQVTHTDLISYILDIVELFNKTCLMFSIQYINTFLYDSHLERMVLKPQ